MTKPQPSHKSTIDLTDKLFTCRCMCRGSRNKVISPRLSDTGQDVKVALFYLGTQLLYTGHTYRLYLGPVVGMTTCITIEYKLLYTGHTYQLYLGPVVGMTTCITMELNEHPILCTWQERSAFLKHTPVYHSDVTHMTI